MTKSIISNAPPYANEVCVRHRIPPKFIKGFVLQTSHQREELVKGLRTAGLITQNHLGQECVNLIPIDKFIHVGNFKKEYWN